MLALESDSTTFRRCCRELSCGSLAVLALGAGIDDN